MIKSHDQQGERKGCWEPLARVLSTNRYYSEFPPLWGPVDKMTREVIHPLSTPFAPFQWGYFLDHRFLPGAPSHCLPGSRGLIPGSKTGPQGADPQTYSSVLPASWESSQYLQTIVPLRRRNQKSQSKTSRLPHIQISPGPGMLPGPPCHVPHAVSTLEGQNGH